MPDDDPTPAQAAAASRPASRVRPNRSRKLVRKRERLAEALFRANPTITNEAVLHEVRAKSGGVGVSLETLAALRERFRPRPRAAPRAQTVAASVAPAPETGGDPVAILAATVRALFPRATRVTLRFDCDGNPVVELTQAGKVGP